MIEYHRELSVLSAGADESLAGLDPVLVHLLRSARSSAVRQQFLRMPPEQYTLQHEVKLLVRGLPVDWIF